MPRLLPQAVEMIVIATKDQVLEELPFSAREIEELTSLREGFFPEDAAPLIFLKARDGQGTLFSAGENGTVLRFPSTPKKR